MQRYFNYARLNPASSSPAPLAQVQVFSPVGTQTLATIYDDNSQPPTPKANPFLADSNAFFYFYAADGEYDIRLSGGGITDPYTWGDVQLLDGVNVDPAWHNVQAYGAVGDGVTNDLPAFQAAVAAACPGGTIYIPPLSNGKFYNLDAGLVITSCRGIRILGGGATAVIAATDPNADAITLNGSSYFYLHGFTIQGVAGGGSGIIVGKSDGSAPSFFGVIDNIILPPNLDGDGIVVHHGMGLRILNVTGTPDVTRPSTDAALNGGVYGPNVATTTSTGIKINLQASGQNNAISIINPVIDGWRGFALSADSVDILLIQGNILEGCARNHALLTNPAQIKLVNCSRTTINAVYTETVLGDPVDNIYLRDCDDVTIMDVIHGAAAANSGGIRLVNCARCRLINTFGEDVIVDATCIDTVLDGVTYGGNGGELYDTGIRTQRTRLRRINATNAMHVAQTIQPQQNLLLNPGAEQWLAATTPADFEVINCTATRTGTGEADTEKFRGRFAIRLDTRTNATNGLRFIVTDYADATLRAELVGQQITFSMWMKVTAGGAAPVISAYYDNGAQTDDTSSRYDLSAGGWQKVGGTFIIRTGFALLDVRVNLPAATSVVYLDELCVTYGEAQTQMIADRLQERGPYGRTIVAYGTTVNVDHAAAPLVSVTLTGNVTTLNLLNMIPGKPLTIKFTQDAVGGFTVAGWAVSGGTVNWAGGAAPVIAAAANAVSTVTLLYDGTNVYELSRVLGY